MGEWEGGKEGGKEGGREGREGGRGGKEGRGEEREGRRGIEGQEEGRAGEREGDRKGRREGGKTAGQEREGRRGRAGGRQGRREGGRKRGREEERAGEREGGRQGRREGGRKKGQTKMSKIKEQISSCKYWYLIVYEYVYATCMYKQNTLLLPCLPTSLLPSFSPSLSPSLSLSQPTPNLQCVVFLLQHLVPQSVGSALHDGLGHRLVATAPPLLLSLLPPPQLLPRVREYHLQQAVRHTLEEFHIHVRLVEYDVGLTRISTHCLHQSLLVFIGRRDGRELKQDDPVKCPEHISQW